MRHFSEHLSRGGIALYIYRTWPTTTNTPSVFTCFYDDRTHCWLLVELALFNDRAVPVPVAYFGVKWLPYDYLSLFAGVQRSGLMELLVLRKLRTLGVALVSEPPQFQQPMSQAVSQVMHGPLQWQRSPCHRTAETFMFLGYIIAI